MSDIDNKEPVCPYIYCYNGKKCSMYRKKYKNRRGGIFAFLFQKR